MRWLTRMMGVLALTGALAACGGGSSDGGAPAAPAQITIAPNTVLLTQSGQQKPLTATVYDASGTPLPAQTVQWESSNPAAVAVSAAGVLTATGAGGSSQIVAVLGAVRSKPLLAVHTEVPADALLLTDAQIVGEPEETTPDAPASLANTYRVRLAGGPAPQPGTLLLNTESKIVGGRVQSVETVGGEHIVTLVRVPAREMFPRLQLSEVFDLRQAEVVIPPALQNSYQVRREGDTFVFEPITGRVDLTGQGAKLAASATGRDSPQAALSIEFKKGPFTCKPALDGAAGAGSEVMALTKAPSFSVALSPSLDVKYTEANGLERFVLMAQPGFTSDAGLQVLVAMEGKITCEVELLSIRLPIGGPIALVIGGQLPVGMGVEVGGKLTAANIGISAKTSVGTGLSLGLDCPNGTNCAVVHATEPLKVGFTPSVDAPGVEDLRFEPSLSVYGFVKAAIGNPFLRSLRFDAFKAKIGVALKGNFAPQSTQMEDPAYQSDYKLLGEIKAGADTNFLDLAAFLGLNNVAENLFEPPPVTIASTPVGTVTANKPDVVFGETVEFTVKLDPAKTDFLPLVGPYNVKRVLLVRHAHVLDARVVASVDALPGQTEFRIPVTPASSSEAGPSDQFHAFVVTTLLPSELLSLELGRASASNGVKGERISAGTLHTCALTSAGGVKCWGFNDFGQLGDGSQTNRLVPVDVTGLGSGVVAVSAGSWHTCALTSAGGVKCWGTNGTGQLGDGNPPEFADGSDTDSAVPVNVIGLGSGVNAVSAGGYHTCVLTSAGGVKCWGDNFFGQLGDGSQTDRLVPVDVAGLGSGVIAVSAGTYHTCALTSAGGVKCWGYNSSGQLGDGSQTDRLAPVDVAGLGSGVVAVSADSFHTCALTSGGGVKCWGHRGNGALGDASDSLLPSLVPVDVAGLGSGVNAVSAGGYHTCALTSAGGATCWGYNGNGSLGDGTLVNSLVPVAVTGFP